MSIRMRQTRSKTGKRRSHHAITEVRLSTCEKCGAKHVRHRACDECGSYRGREVVNTTKKLEKKMKKEKNIEESKTASEKEKAS